MTPAIPSGAGAVGDRRRGTRAHEHDDRGFVRRYVFSTDHKIIGIQYILTGLVMALVGARARRR